MKNQYAVIIAIIVVILVAIFAVINVDAVEVNYLFGTGQAPLVLVILISVLMGGILTASAGAIKMYQLQRENKKLKTELAQLKGKSNKGISESKASTNKHHKETKTQPKK
ncbi:uncharacterized protein JNUCC1_03404 [Lentibacillus sp. JNUCC-1]|uniref:LapA family protein n=1 Tax=Lentibacillus sp. JNUCC-1 TaxID=2654513 RepID=UPI0012E8AB3A|nr:lipopolysaccharide assembly protein LapA domain-containing protein [Lentibacillus sp. JNUCC-1]MUV39526.1 uncharacterized protein [Lentibacillus sp. JNUCC-1]